MIQLQKLRLVFGHMEDGTQKTEGQTEVMVEIVIYICGVFFFLCEKGVGGSSVVLLWAGGARALPIIGSDHKSIIKVGFGPPKYLRQKGLE